MLLGISLQVGWNAALSNDTELCNTCYHDFLDLDPALDVANLVEMRKMLGQRLIESLRREGKVAESDRLERELKSWISNSRRRGRSRAKRYRFSS